MDTRKWMLQFIEDSETESLVRTRPFGRYSFKVFAGGLLPWHNSLTSLLQKRSCMKLQRVPNIQIQKMTFYQYQHNT